MSRSDTFIKINRIYNIGDILIILDYAIISSNGLVRSIIVATGPIEDKEYVNSTRKKTSLTCSRILPAAISI